MKTLVMDASIAIKWVVEEEGAPEALMLQQRVKLIAPDLLVGLHRNTATIVTPAV